MSERRNALRRFVLERRDLQADLCEARLRVIDAEAAGLDVAELRQHGADLEARDNELAYAQRQLSAEIAAAEAAAEPETFTLLAGG